MILCFLCLEKYLLRFSDTQTGPTQPFGATQILNENLANVVCASQAFTDKAVIGICCGRHVLFANSKLC